MEGISPSGSGQNPNIAKIFTEKEKAAFKANEKRRKLQARIAKASANRQQVKRAQRYLGLRSRGPSVMLSKSGPGTLPSYPVLVSIDIEVWERNHNLLTEVGISTLYTNDLLGIEPGENGKDWLAKIKHRHLRIEENKHQKNGTFVDDMSERFEFGTSEWISNADAARRVEDALTLNTDGGPRSVVLVGHNISSDLGFLRKMKCDFTKLDNVIDIVDTDLMYRSLKNETNARSLSFICNQLDIDAWCVHNAGNDAAYTLQCLVLMSLYAEKIRGGEDCGDSDGGNGIVNFGE